MKNLLSTIPKSKYKSWEQCLLVLQCCDGTTKRQGKEWFWLINTKSLPKETGIGAQVFMIYDGLIRGYFDLVGIDTTENCQQNGLGYCHVLGELIQEIPWNMVDFIPTYYQDFANN